MKLYQNRVDRFCAIAKKLVDQHAADYFKECCTTEDKFSAYSSHYDTLGAQLEQYAKEFIKNTKSANEHMRAEIWRTCTHYLELFARTNSPNRLNQVL